MHFFVTGGSGLTGPSVVSELLRHGHKVTGLARSEQSAKRLRSLGATAHQGALQDLDRLSLGAAESDGVLHMGFGGDFGDSEGLVRSDVAAIKALGLPLEGTDKPFVITSGTFAMQAGSISSETDTPDPDSIAHFRIPGEDACLSFVQLGVRASVVRLPPTVHGPGDYGFIASLVTSARATGVSAYIADGTNRWPAVHREDAASLFRLALEHGAAGSAFHAVAEEAITLRAIAEKIGAMLKIPVVSISQEEADAHFEHPFYAMAYGVDAPASSQLTRERLGWRPTHVTLLEDLERGGYVK